MTRNGIAWLRRIALAGGVALMIFGVCLISYVYVRDEGMHEHWLWTHAEARQTRGYTSPYVLYGSGSAMLVIGGFVVALTCAPFPALPERIRKTRRSKGAASGKQRGPSQPTRPTPHATGLEAELDKTAKLASKTGSDRQG